MASPFAVGDLMRPSLGFSESDGMSWVPAQHFDFPHSALLFRCSLLSDGGDPFERYLRQPVNVGANNGGLPSTMASQKLQEVGLVGSCGGCSLFQEKTRWWQVRCFRRWCDKKSGALRLGLPRWDNGQPVM